jgi:hypothetical protein
MKSGIRHRRVTNAALAAGLFVACWAMPATAGTPLAEWLRYSPGAMGDPEVYSHLFYGDRARQIAGIDAGGNTFVAFSIAGGFGDGDIVVQKFDGGGAILWSSTFDGAYNLSDKVVALVVDGLGDVVLTGTEELLFTGEGTVTVKFDGATGERLWVARPPDAPGRSGAPTAIAVDEDGDVVVTGWVQDANGSTDYVTAKYRAIDGVPAWTLLVGGFARFDGAAGLSDTATDVAIDGDGDVVVTGFSQAGPGIGSGSRYATIKYDGATGFPAWSSLPNAVAIHPTGGSRPFAVAIDSHDDVIVSGDSDGLFTTIKYDGDDGLIAWSGLPSGAAIHPAEVDIGGVNAVTVDQDDDVIVVGGAQSQSPLGDTEAVTIKYAAATGEILWTGLADGAARFGGGGQDVARAVAVASNGDIIVSGSMEAFLPSAVNNFVIRYDGASGAPVWGALPDGAAILPGLSATLSSIPDYGGQHVVLDAIDDVRIAAVRAGSPSSDLLLAGVDGTNGSVTWLADEGSTIGLTEYPGCSTEPGDGSMMAVDIVGNTYVAGSGNSGNDFDVVTYKFDPSGALLWRRQWSAGVDSQDYACALALDPAGDVVVGGHSSGNFVALKYDGASGIPLWQSEHLAATNDIPRGLVVGADGDVTLTGRADITFATSESLTVHIAGTDGAELWSSRRAQPSGNERSCCVAADALTGDVFLLGSEQVAGMRVLFMQRLSALDGSVLWSGDVAPASSSSQEATGLALDGDGDVIVLGAEQTASGTLGAATFKLDAATGAQRWRRTSSLAQDVHFRPAALALDAAGNLAVAGYATQDDGNSDFAIIRLSNQAGEPLWTERTDGFAVEDLGGFFLERANAAAMDATGTTWTVGRTEFPAPEDNDSIAALLGHSPAGRLAYRYRYSESDHRGEDDAFDVGVAPDGSLRIAALTGSSQGYRIALLRLDPRRAADWARLTALESSQGILVPAFDPSVQQYRIDVPYAVTSLTLTPTADRPSASLSVDGSVVASGTASSPVPLATGTNAVRIESRVDDAGAERTVIYTIDVVRARLAQTITFEAPSTRLLSEGAFAISATADSQLPVTVVSLTPTTCSIAADLVTPLAIGECTLRATQAGDADHEPWTAEHVVTLVADGAVFADGFEDASGIVAAPGLEDVRR